jgi:hypothetical protein
VCSGNGQGGDKGQEAVNKHTGLSHGWTRGSFGGPRRNGETDRKPRDPTDPDDKRNPWGGIFCWVVS